MESIVLKCGGGGFQRAGIPDILCCINSKFVAIELKTETGKLSKLQEYNLCEINNNKGKTFVLRPSDFEEFKKWVMENI